MKFLILFGILYETVKCTANTSKNVTIEVMFVVSSEVYSWDEMGYNFTTKDYMFDVFNGMKDLYAQLSIHLLLHDFAIQNDEKMFGPEDERLKNNTDWELTMLYENYWDELGTSRTQFPDAILFFLPPNGDNTEGVTLRSGAICNHDALAIVSVYEDVSYTTRIAAHELGHILAVPHSEDAECLKHNVTSLEDTDHIMDESISTLYSENWSECTREWLTPDKLANLTASAENPNCLYEESESYELFSEPLCGNGIVEGDEECDRGLCCDDDCHFKVRGTTCRNSTGTACDYDDICSGDSQNCPVSFAVDGTPCESGRCYMGECKNQTQDDYCQEYFGPESKHNSDCIGAFRRLNECHLHCVGPAVEGYRKGIEQSYNNITCKSLVPRYLHNRWKAAHGFNVDVYAQPWIDEGTSCGTNGICQFFNPALPECVSADLIQSECPGNGTCSGNGRCYQIELDLPDSEYKEHLNCHCDVIESTFSIQSWSGLDCSVMHYQLKAPAKIILAVTILVTLTLLIINAIINRKDSSTDSAGTDPPETTDSSETLLN